MSSIEVTLAKNLVDKRNVRSPQCVCVVSWDGKERFRTQSAETINPIWNEDFKTDDLKIGSVVEFMVVDRHLLQPDVFLGKAIVKIEPSAVKNQLILSLNGPDGSKTDSQIYVRFRLNNA
eukprot:TRINITY_DN8080_c0_g1_i1.p1 TRINITY_DN8080_c0_g1~~TRINITY_DN8080_c0_g1_i1.p1  ORF type:complete len:120 (-),score=41.79 TRINITY_DN8080_c0_g1_i1:97-456(-)